ncbi:carbohydrate-binding module family 13 protein [Rhizophagus clarus]|uniref:Carbohydrate-binding module family 13 protein n=1 Tax=Rhizophagus clarus TaxID=94130 RepID=A0A8H3M1S9_9GLOM|nr:carbohydrate-binding module family 13 protein [Rhizophagus clarus]
MDENKLLPKLSQNLLEVLNDEEYYDVTIEVVNIKLPNISPEIFQIILRYIYCGKLSLSDDNIQMDEIEVWKHVLKWGLAQNPELPSDPTNFSKEDFNILRNCLQHCIPYIKFYNLTSDEFSDEILPYKKILPKELYKDLLKYFLNPKNQTDKKSKPRMITKEINIDSKIITHQHAELILKWIDRLEITDEIKNMYKFKLLLRGTRDGFTTKQFHEICDNQSHTVTIIKVKEGGEILGGYNPIAWKSDEYNEICEESYNDTKDSFIFSFMNVENYILSRVKNNRFAILNHRNFGPSFGDGDLILLEDCGNCSNNDYEKHIRKTTDDFSVEEYEVFQVIK